MRASQRIGIGFAFALLLVSAVGIFSLSSTRGFIRFNDRVRRTSETLYNVNRVMAYLGDLENSARGYVITGDTTYLTLYREVVVGVDSQIAALQTLTANEPAQSRRVADIARLARRKVLRSDQTNSVMQRLGFDSAAALIRGGRGKAVMDTIRMRVREVEHDANIQLSEYERGSAVSANRTEAIVGTGAALAFILLLLAGLTIAREFGVRRRAETAVRESQAQLTQFLDSLPIGAFVIDANGQPTFANTTALSMLGAATLDDLATVPHETTIPLWRDVDHAALPAAEDPMRAALRGLAAQREGLEIHVGDTTIPIEISAAPVFDSTGEVAFAIAAFSDITERQRARQALEMATKAAEDSNRAKSDFLARMSHELRTPLNSVIGFANILLKNKAGNLREQDISYLQRVLDNGKHLLVLINDILDLSKIEAGKVQVEWEPVDLESMLTETVQQLETQARPGVRLAAIVPPGLEPVTSDSARLRQIMINLIGNALKFTQEGSVIVSVTTDPAGFRASNIKVTDTGIGIPHQRLNAIFDAFEQAEHSTSRQYGGTGLGLPISRALCELLGYTLTVTSEEGAGTEFCVDLRAEEKRRMTGPDGKMLNRRATDRIEAERQANDLRSATARGGIGVTPGSGPA